MANYSFAEIAIYKNGLRSDLHPYYAVYLYSCRLRRLPPLLSKVRNFKQKALESREEAKAQLPSTVSKPGKQYVFHWYIL